MADRLERFINLITKTGDKLLVYDRHSPDDSFVVVGLEQYEKLMAEAKAVEDLTEDELIDKINSDIALWKRGQATEPTREAVSTTTNFSVAQEMQRPKTSPLAKKPKTSFWTIPESRRKEAEEVIEEGRQYIEEPPF